MNPAGAVPELAVPADVPSLEVTFAAAFSDDAMIRVTDKQRAPAGGPMIWFMQAPRTPPP